MGREQGRVFTINPLEAQTSNMAGTGMILIDEVKVRRLFDSRIIYMVTPLYFTKRLNKDKYP